jgi:signal transduction histidine kinase
VASETIALRDEGRRARAVEVVHRDLREVSNRLSGVLMRAEETNTAEVRWFTSRIEALRADLRRVAILLNALSALFAAVVLVIVLMVVRTQRRAEASYTTLLQERAQEMEVFAARVAHDILSPLTSAALALEHLSMTAAPELRAVARRGLGGIARVQTTVDGLLAFARAAGHPEPGSTDVAAVARALLDSFHDESLRRHVVITLEVGLDTPAVVASEGVVASILANLIENAIKYMGDASDRRIMVRVLGAGEAARMEVEDSGPGIPADVQRSVFEPYFRAGNAGARGLGLGLATVKRLVEAHHGTLGLRSAPARGSLFWVELPRARGLSPRAGPRTDVSKGAPA